MKPSVTLPLFPALHSLPIMRIEADPLVHWDLYLARRVADMSAWMLQAMLHKRYTLVAPSVATSNGVVQDWGK